MNYFSPYLPTLPDVFKILFLKLSVKSVVALLQLIHFGSNMSHYWKGFFFVLRTVSEIISADTGL